MFPRSGYFFYEAPPMRFARRIGLSGGVSAVISIAMCFLCVIAKIDTVFDHMQIFCLFFLTNSQTTQQLNARRTYKG